MINMIEHILSSQVSDKKCIEFLHALIQLYIEMTCHLNLHSKTAAVYLGGIDYKRKLPAVKLNIFDQTQMICKIVFGKQIHLLSHLSTFPCLISFIRCKFSKLPRLLTLTYQDQEGDEITLSCDDDLRMFRLLHASYRRFPKIVIREQTKQVFDSSFQVLQEEEDAKEIKHTELIAKRNAQTKPTQQKLEIRLQPEQEDADDEEIIWQLTIEDAKDRDEKLLRSLVQDQENLIKDLAKSYTADLANKVEKYLSQMQQQKTRQLAKQTVDRIECTSIARYLQLVEKSPQRGSHRSKSSGSKSASIVQKLVENCIEELLPTIVDGVASRLEQNFSGKCKELIRVPVFRQESSELERRLASASRPRRLRP